MTSAMWVLAGVGATGYVSALVHMGVVMRANDGALTSWKQFTGMGVAVACMISLAVVWVASA